MDDNQPLGREGQEGSVSGAAVQSEAPQELNMEECERASPARSSFLLSSLLNWKEPPTIEERSRGREDDRHAAHHVSTKCEHDRGLDQAVVSPPHWKFGFKESA